ncbi:tetratricopeptide repeat protein [Saccharicrinis aurantiacus]|uniref:tetratricopeptide repeat protein n=1 Tax=Saccharicrinis aurantiacus TaxID=1849719 RepID=UPI002491804B|nr:hypothetical protein [Saccharicrinis aurantiacus]
MKNTVFSLSIFLFSILFTNQITANSYEDAMTANINKMYMSQTPEDLLSISGYFYRVAETEKDKWIPLYYASYSLVRITYLIKDADVIDTYLDEAQTYVDKLLKSNPEESEIHILQAIIYSMRITSMARGMKYSGLSNASIDRAEKLNPNNPRAYYCRGNNILHTPTAFGGGKKNALPLYQKAEKLYATWRSPEKFWPDWDIKHNKKMIQKCISKN